MSADRLRPVDRVLVDMAAAVADAAATILDAIDMRHYYGDLKMGTKAEIRAAEARLRADAASLRQMVEASSTRDDSTGEPTLPGIQIRKEILRMQAAARQVADTYGLNG